MQQLHDIASRHKALAASGITLSILLAFAGNASAATLSVGPGKTFAAPCAAIGAAHDGDIIEIAGNNTYSGDVCGIYAANLTIRGVNGRPKIDAAGKNAMGKAIWVAVGNNLTVENVEMFGAKVPDMNGAAFRLEGTGFTLRSSYLHDNENGILAGANTNSNVLVENTEFGHNGAGDGRSHNLYIGNVKSLTFRYNYSHDANVGHDLKSRAITNTIVYNRFSSSGLGQPSYEIDLPNAGTSYVIGNVIEQPSANQNPALLAYGEEGASNPAQDLYVVNNTFLNDDASRGTFVMVGSEVTKPVLLQNNIFAGTGAATNQANAIDKTNYRSVAPAFVNRAGYDLHPGANAPVINAGSAPGNAATGVSLAPVAQYKHTAAGETRPATGVLDIGAYEAGGTTTPVTTTPTPTPTPAPTPTPTPTAGWTACATEGGTCSFSGTRQVRFGANGAYITKTVTGPVACTWQVFGDPINGVVKACSIADTATGSTGSTTPTPTTPAPAPAPAPTNGGPVASTGWTACATEGGTCNVSGTRQVRFGANGYYVTKTVTGSVACTWQVFGDPVNGVVKACSYAN